MPIRILHVLDTLAVGGLQNGLANLIDHMDHARFEHVICAMRPINGAHAQRFSASRARVINLSKQESDARFQIRTLARHVREVKPDIVHTRNWGTAEAVLAARYAGRCARVHGEHGIDWDTTTREPVRRILLRRLAFQLADRVLCVSRHLKLLHARRTRFPADKITVIRNGVNQQRFFPDGDSRARIRRQWGLADNEFCIGCVGNLIPVKDHLTLLQAIDLLALVGQPWRLAIVGDGPELPNLTAFVNARPIWRDRVLFLGRSTAVPEVLNAMDVFVVSSLTEGISNSLLEAMATGLPVVVSATGGNPEVVLEGESGMLFPVGNVRRLSECLLTLQANQDLCLRLGEKALRRVCDEFSIDSMVRKYEDVYESLASTGAAPVHAAARV
jgi:sugar transferase (PEP-CTERM/EpsH1 system associated)